MLLRLFLSAYVVCFFLLGVHGQPGRSNPPRLVSSTKGTLTIESPRLAPGAISVEIYKDECTSSSSPTYAFFFLGSPNFHVSVTNLRTNSMCRFKARGVGSDLSRGEWSFVVAFSSASVPDWGIIPMTLTPMGVDAVLVSWVEPDNGGSPITGYKLWKDNGDQNFVVEFDGSGYPTVRQLVVTGLLFDVTYTFRLYALNGVGNSEPLTGVYTVQVDSALDPSKVQGSLFPMTITAGIESSVVVQAVHPITNADEQIGGSCSVAINANCLPGRMFVSFLQEVCEVDIEGTTCVRVREDHPRWQSDRLDGRGAQKPRLAHDNGDGTYTLYFTGYREGMYSLVIQSIWQNGLISQFWDNEVFFGQPVSTDVDPQINHDWGAGLLVRRSVDFVTARWSGYIQPSFSDDYTFYCDADDHCRLWVDGYHLIEKWGQDGQCCTDFFGGPISLLAGQLYSIKVEYRETTDSAKLVLLWSSTFWQPKATVPSSAFWRGGFITSSPFVVDVQVGAPQANMSEVVGLRDIVLRPRAGMVNYFFVQTKDIAGNNLTFFDPSTSILATFTHANESNMTSFRAEVYNPTVLDGLYQIRFNLIKTGPHWLSVRLNGQEVKDSPFMIQVGSGPPSALTTAVNGSGAVLFVAGVPNSFEIHVRDAFGNLLTDPGLWSEKDFKAWMVWQPPPVPFPHCNPIIEGSWRTWCSDKFSFIDDYLVLYNLSHSKVYANLSRHPERPENTIIATYTGFRQGTHTWFASLNETRIRGLYSTEPWSLTEAFDDRSEYVQGLWTATGVFNPEAYGPMSLVQDTDLVSLSQTEVRAGETTISVRVHLRDKYGNLIFSNSTDYEVTARAGEKGEVSEHACVFDPSTTGQWQCTFVPTVSGDGVPLSVNIAGLPASVTVGSTPDQNCYLLPCGIPGCPCLQDIISGPHPLKIYPGTPYPNRTTVECPCFESAGQMVAGDPVGVPALVQVRDFHGNLHTSNHDFIGTFLNAQRVRGRLGQEIWLDPAIDNENGTFTLMVKSPRTGSYPLHILVGVSCVTPSEASGRAVEEGTTCIDISDSPSPSLTFLPNEASAWGSNCIFPPQDFLSAPRAGEAFPIECQPRDDNFNDVTSNNLFLLAEMTGPAPQRVGDVSTVPSRLVKQWGYFEQTNRKYRFDLRPQIAGFWNISMQIVRQFGSRVEIFRAPHQAPASLVAPFLEASNVTHSFRYNRVDKEVSFLYPHDVAPHSAAPSARWSGRWSFWIKMNTSDYYQLKLKTTGGNATLLINGTSCVPEGGEQSPECSRWLPNDFPIPCEASYSHLSGDAMMQLSWKFQNSSMSFRSIPSYNTFYSLPIQNSEEEQIPPTAPVLVRVTSGSEVVNTSTADNYVQFVAGESNFIFVRPRDIWGNPLDRDMTFHTLDDIQAYVSGRLKITMTNLGGGKYQGTLIPSVAEDGLQLHINIRGRPVFGSPFYCRVIAGPADPLQTVRQGPGVEGAISGIETYFDLIVRDSQGNSRGTKMKYDSVSCAPFVSCFYNNVTVTHRCLYVPGSVGRKDIFCQVNGENILSSPAYFPVYISPQPVTLDNATFPLMSSSTNNQWPSQWHRRSPVELYFKYQDVNANPFPGDNSVVLYCEAESPSRVSWSQPSWQKLLISPVPLDTANSRFSFPFNGNTFLFSGEYHVSCGVARRGGLGRRLWRSPWPNLRPQHFAPEVQESPEFLALYSDARHASAIWDGLLDVPSSGTYTLFLSSPPTSIFLSIFLNGTSNSSLRSDLATSLSWWREVSVSLTIAQHSPLRIQLHAYGLTGEDPVRFEWESSLGMVRQEVPAHYQSFGLRTLKGFPRLVNATDICGPVSAFHRAFNDPMEEGKAMVAWSPPKEVGMLGVSYYTLEMKESEAATWHMINSNLLSSSRSFFVQTPNIPDPLDPEVRYNFRLIAYNPAGSGEEKIITLLPSFPPPPPESPPELLATYPWGEATIKPISPRTTRALLLATLSISSGYQDIFNVTYPGRTNQTMNWSTNPQAMNFSNLEEGRTYYVWSFFTNDVGRSPLSEPLVFTCCQTHLLPPPTGLERDWSLKNSYSSISLKWNPVLNSSNISYLQVTHYSVVMWRESHLANESRDVFDTTTFEWSDLGARQAHYFCLRTHSRLGAGRCSEPVALYSYPLFTQPPLRLVKQTESEIGVEWDPVVNASGYRLYANGRLAYDGGRIPSKTNFVVKGDNLNELSNVTLVHLNISHITKGKVYNITLRVVNLAGEGPAGVPLEAIAANKPRPPSTPQKVYTKIKKDRIELTAGVGEGDEGDPVVLMEYQRRALANYTISPFTKFELNSPASYPLPTLQWCADRSFAWCGSDFTYYGFVHGMWVNNSKNGTLRCSVDTFYGDDPLPDYQKECYTLEPTCHEAPYTDPDGFTCIWYSAKPDRCRLSSQARTYCCACGGGSSSFNLTRCAHQDEYCSVHHNASSSFVYFGLLTSLLNATHDGGVSCGPPYHALEPWPDSPYPKSCYRVDLKHTEWKTIGYANSSTAWRILDRAVVPYLRYEYRASGHNSVAVGDKNWSPIATLQAALPPTSPVLSPVRGSRLGRITVTWTEPTTTLKPVYYKVLIDGELKVETSKRTYSVLRCIKGKFYDFQVQAYTSGGEASWSDHLTRPCASIPGPPGRPFIIDTDCEGPGGTEEGAIQPWVHIGWTPPEDNGGVPLKGYKIIRAKHNDPLNFIFIDPVTGVTPDTLNFTDIFTDDLRGGYWYRYQVIAFNGVNDFDASNASEAITAYCGSPPPSIYSIWRDSPPQYRDGIVVYWNVTWHDNLADGYRVYMSDLDRDSEPRLMYDSGGAPFLDHRLIRGLRPGGKYRAWVAVVRGMRESEWRQAREDWFVGILPSAPIRVVSRYPQRVSWDPPEDMGETDLVRYEVLVREAIVDGQRVTNGTIDNTTIEHVHPPFNRLLPSPTLFQFGHMYRVNIRAVTGAGTGPSSLTVLVSGGFPQRQLEASVVHSSRTSLSFEWERDGWPKDIFLDSGDGGTLKRIVGGALAGFHTIRGLQPGLKYTGLIMNSKTCPMVQCLTTPLPSDAVSNPIEGFTADRPSAPLNLRIDSLYYGYVRIRWDPPGDDGGLPVSHYLIKRDLGIGREGMTSPLDFVESTQLFFEDTNSTWFDKSPDEGEVFVFKYEVLAKSPAGLSAPSPRIQVWMAPIPTKPPLVVVENSTLSSVRLSWLVTHHALNWEVVDAELGVVYRSNNSVPQIKEYKRITLTGLIPGKKYLFAVRAINIGGVRSELTDFVEAWTATRPNPPSNFHRITSDCFRANISSNCSNPNTTIPCMRLGWDPPPEEETGCPVEVYRITWGDRVIAPRLISIERSFEFESLDLKCGQWTSYSIQSMNCRGEWSEPSSLSLLQGSPPLAVCEEWYLWNATFGCVSSGLNYTATDDPTEFWFFWNEAGEGSSAFTVPFEDALGLSSNNTLLGYQLFVDDGYEGPFNMVFDGASKFLPYTTRFRFSGATPGLTYRAYVKAVTAVGPGYPSNIIEAIACTYPDAPTITELHRATRVSFNVFWKAPPFTGYAPLTHYTIQRKQDLPGQDYYTMKEDPSGAFEGPFEAGSAEVHDIIQNSFYFFRIAANNRAGRSPWSNVVYGLTGDFPLNAPIPFLTAANRTHINIQWEPLDVAQELGVSFLIDERFWTWGYRVWGYSPSLNTTPVSMWNASREEAITTATVGPLKCGLSWCFGLRLWTLIGDGNLDQNQLCLELTDLPGRPLNLSALVTNSTGVTLGWETPSVRSCGEIVEYVIEGSGGGLGSSADPWVALAFTSELHFALNGFPRGQTFDFRIKARTANTFTDCLTADRASCTNLWGPPSNTLRVIIAEVADPPRQIVTRYASSRSMIFEWFPPEASSGISSFEIYDLEDVLIKRVPRVGLNNSYALHSVEVGTEDGLEPGQEYSIRVRSVNEQGPGYFAQSQCFFLGAPPLSPPDSIRSSNWGEIVSNSFSVMPYQASAATVEGTIIRLATTEPGQVYVALFPSYQSSVPSPDEIQNLGGDAICGSSAFAAGTGDVIDVNIVNCGLKLDTPYRGFVSTSGIVAPAIEIATPPGISNYFTILPKFYRGHLSEDGGILIFSVAYPGFAWVNVTHENDASYRMGSPACRVDGREVNVLETGNISWTLSACNLQPLQQYRIQVYISGNSRQQDGSSYSFFSVTRPSSNKFVVHPYTTGPITGDGGRVGFVPKLAGKAWVAAVERNRTNDPRVLGDMGEVVSDPPLVTYLHLRNGEHPLIKCVTTVTLSQNTTQNVLLSGCGLFTGEQVYSFVVYIVGEDLAPGAMASTDVQISPSNVYLIYPRLLDISAEMLRIRFFSRDPGYAWILAVGWQFRDHIDLFTLKEELDSDCSKRNLTIKGNTESTFNLPCSKLTAGEGMAVFVYIEGLFGNNDGHIYGPLRGFVPYSSRYTYQPRLIGAPSPAYPSPSTFNFSLQVSNAQSNLWLCLSNSSNVSQWHIKDQNFYCLGGASCRVKNLTVGADPLSFNFTSCSNLSYRFTYYLHSYVQGIRPTGYMAGEGGDPDDGSVSIPLKIDVPTSNVFSYGPFPSFITKHYLVIDFVPFRDGRVWFQVIPEELRIPENSTSYESARFGWDSVCFDTSWQNRSVIGGASYSLNMTNCSIIPGREYLLQSYLVGPSTDEKEDGVIDENTRIYITPSNELVNWPNVDKSPDFASAESTALPLRGPGYLYVFLIEAGTPVNYWDIRGFPNKYPYDGNDFTCTRRYSTPDDPGDVKILIQPCFLSRSVHYKMVLYIESQSADPSSPDGYLLPEDRWPDLVFPAVSQSNFFFESPKITYADFEKIEFYFTSVLTGKAYFHLTRQVDFTRCYGMITTNANAIKDRVCAVTRDINCAGVNMTVVTGQRNTFSSANGNALSGCGVEVNTAYYLVVYLEDNQNNNDGFHYYAPLYIPSSNSFRYLRVKPDSPSGDGFTIQTNLTAPGKLWAAVDVDIDQEAVMNALTCRLQPTPNDLPTAVQVVDAAITGCSLSQNQWHWLIVYATDAVGGDDGQLEAISFFVPVSGGFSVPPQLVEYSVTTDGLNVELQTNMTASTGGGRVWAQIASQQPSVKSTSLALGTPTCRFMGDYIDERLTMLEFKGCNLGNVDFAHLAIYIEDWRGYNDGSFYFELLSMNDLLAYNSSSLIIPAVYNNISNASITATSSYVVPDTRTNAFAELPFIQQVLPEIVFSFSTEAVGRFWVAMTEIWATLSFPSALDPLSPEIICMLGNRTVFSTAVLHYTLSSCEVRTGTAYKLYFYLEGTSGPPGATAWRQIQASASNDFLWGPFLHSTPLPNKISVKFNSTNSGLAWMTISEVLGSAGGFVDPSKVANGSHALSPFCGLYNQSVVGKETSVLTLSNCSKFITFEKQYDLNIYVSGSHRFDGGLSVLPVVIRSQANNFFELTPVPLHVSQDSVRVGYQGNVSYGWSYIGIWPRTLRPDRRQIRQFEGAAGLPSCRNSSVLNFDYTVHTLKGCNLSANSRGMYNLMVYVESARYRTSEEGEVFTLPIELPRRNAFHLYPHITGSITPNQVSFEFIANQSGHAWAFISRHPIAMLDDVMTSSPSLILSSEGCLQNQTITGYPDLTHWTISSCIMLQPRRRFYLYVYVSVDTISVDGALSDPIRLDVVGGLSNSIISSIYIDQTTPDGARITFTPEKSGAAWVQIVSRPFCVEAESVMLGRNAMGDERTCRVNGSAILAAKSVSYLLTSCRLHPDTSYWGIVYVSSLAKLSDGYLSLPTEFNVGSSSNWFLQGPTLSQTPIFADYGNRHIVFEVETATTNGSLWATVLPQEYVRNMTLKGFLNYTKSAGPENTCVLNEVPVLSGGLRNYTLQWCPAHATLTYGLLVYVNSMGFIGTLAPKMYFTIPQYWTNLTFARYPRIISPVSRYGFTFTANITGPGPGYMWASISNDTDLSAADLLAKRKSVCHLNVPVHTLQREPIDVTFDWCTLEPGMNYYLHAYVNGLPMEFNASLAEADLASWVNDTGDLAPPLRISALSRGYGLSYLKLWWSGYSALISPYLPITAWKLWANGQQPFPIMRTGNDTLSVVVPCIIGVTYKFSVAAFNDQGWGSKSQETGDITCARVPSSPIGLHLGSNRCEPYAYLKWDGLPRSLDGGTKILHYNVYRRTGRDNRNFVRIAKVPAFNSVLKYSYNDTDSSIELGSAFEYKVTGENAAGEGDASLPLVVRLNCPLSDQSESNKFKYQPSVSFLDNKINVTFTAEKSGTARVALFNTSHDIVCILPNVSMIASELVHLQLPCEEEVRMSTSYWVQVQLGVDDESHVVSIKLGSWFTNKLLGPLTVDNSTVTLSSVTIEAKPQSWGTLYAMVIPHFVSFSYSISRQNIFEVSTSSNPYLKTASSWPGGCSTNASGLNISSVYSGEGTEFRVELSGCEFFPRTAYVAYILVVGPGGNATTGQMSSALFHAPRYSNWFMHGTPRRVDDIDVEDIRRTFHIEIFPRLPGKFWLMVTTYPHGLTTTPDGVKALENSLGQSECKVGGRSIDRAWERLLIQIRDCDSLVPLTKYHLHFYLEDELGFMEGHYVRQDMIFPPAPSANFFKRLPELQGQYNQHNVTFNLTANATGYLWAVVLSETNFIRFGWRDQYLATQVIALHEKILRSGCGASIDDTFSEGKEGSSLCRPRKLVVPATPTLVTLSDCDLELGYTYFVLVYITNTEDTVDFFTGCNTGELTGVLTLGTNALRIDVPDKSNDFLALPPSSSGVSSSLVVSNATLSSVQVRFKLKELEGGKVWLGVTQKSGLSNLNFLSSPSSTWVCSLGPQAVVGSVEVSLELWNCPFHRDSLYIVYVYAEGTQGGVGSLKGANFNPSTFRI